MLKPEICDPRGNGETGSAGQTGDIIAKGTQ
jgi:hypothetical protein